MYFLPPLLASLPIRVWVSGSEKWLKATAAEWNERTAGAQPGAAREGRAGPNPISRGKECSMCYPLPWGCLLAAADCTLANFPWATRSCSSNHRQELSNERCFFMLVTLYFPHRRTRGLSLWLGLEITQCSHLSSVGLCEFSAQYSLSWLKWELWHEEVHRIRSLLKAWVMCHLTVYNDSQRKNKLLQFRVFWFQCQN